MRKPCTFTPQANLGMEATIGGGSPLDLSQPQDSHVYAFPPLRYNLTHFLVSQIVHKYWFCSLLILRDGGWVGISFFLVPRLYTGSPLLCCTCSYAAVQLMPIFLCLCDTRTPVTYYSRLWRTCMIARCWTTCRATNYLPHQLYLTC